MKTQSKEQLWGNQVDAKQELEVCQVQERKTRERFGGRNTGKRGSVYRCIKISKKSTLSENK